jgi:predicted phosphodiesterase
VRELVAVGPTSAELFIDGVVRTEIDLAPSTDYVIDGVELRTLDSVGEIRSVVTTVNDVHFGETECGRIDGVAVAAFRVEPGEIPYPELMSAAVVADMAGRQPDAVIVKGDLTSEGTTSEYADFLRCYESAFGDRLTHVRGNHDSYHGGTFANWPVQIRDVPGLRIVLLDTARDQSAGGFVSADQIDATVEAVRASTDTVIVMGHHPMFSPGHDQVASAPGINAEDSAALVAALAPLAHVVAYVAGHTHRCRRYDQAGIAMVEVACVKDFPGAWAEYLVGTTGIAQVVHRASGSAAVAWAEKTRTMFDGYYGTYVMDELKHRCFTLPLNRN